MKLFTMAKEVLGNLFRKPVTRNYPAEVRGAFPGERGRLAIESDKCIYCGMCARKCPANAIKVTRRPDASWNFERFRCILCGSCVDHCPKKCLHLVERNAPDEIKTSPASDK